MKKLSLFVGNLCRQAKNNYILLIVFLVTAVFFGINTYFVNSLNSYALFLFPLIGLVLLLFFFDFNKVLFLIALSTPFALNVAITKGSLLSFPSEPLMILFTVLFVFKVFLFGQYETRILKHPVSIAILISLLWMFITSLFSEMVMVSIKYTLARIWFLIPFYFAIVTVFKDTLRIKKFYWAYCFSLLIVIIYSTVNFIFKGFELHAAHFVMRPFYNDHTAYGVVIALFIPFCYHSLIKDFKISFRSFLIGISFILLCIGLFCSYSRAAWLSVFGCICMFFIIKSKIKMRWILTGAVVCVMLFSAYQAEIIYKLQKNRQDSSVKLSEQIQSIANISTDASNLERLNRWSCAFRMFEEKPVTGWGPGTYQFYYGRYQKSYQLSTISTNFGILGNAHSEYISPLVEQGFIGTILVMIVFALTFNTGVRVYRQAKDPEVRNIAIFLTLGLLTYYFHGFLNNFLDTDKLSVPFWAFTAAIVSLDLYHNQKETIKDTNNLILSDKHHEESNHICNQ